MPDNVSLEIIPSFAIYKPKVLKGLKPVSNLADKTVELLEKQKLPVDTQVKNHFPLILINELPWDLSTRYFLSRPDGTSYRTVIGIARDLRGFMQWVLDNDIDYLSCDRKPKSPPRRYRRWLMSKPGSPNVIKRKLSRVVGFYRWLQDHEGIEFKHSLWEESDFRLYKTSTEGRSISLNVKTTDVQAVPGSGSREQNVMDGYIYDGGRLKPYLPSQQTVIFESLKKIGNTEMTLAFLVSILTGARLQTVFTLRKKHFEHDLKQGQEEVAIYAGSWRKYSQNKKVSLDTEYASLIDTKRGKGLKIYFPRWLYQKIQAYLASERYTTRIHKSKHYLDDSDFQYLFLTTRGSPFYSSKNDPVTRTYLNPPEGSSVQQFVRQQLKPELDIAGFEDDFQFHNLRASYGMNIVRSGLSRLGEECALSLGEIFELVRTRMGHSNLKTTQQYLDFDKAQSVAKKVQGDYESHLIKIMQEFEVNA